MLIFRQRILKQATEVVMNLNFAVGDKLTYIWQCRDIERRVPKCLER